MNSNERNIEKDFKEIKESFKIDENKGLKLAFSFYKFYRAYRNKANKIKNSLNFFDINSLNNRYTDSITVFKTLLRETKPTKEILGTLGYRASTIIRGNFNFNKRSFNINEALNK